MDTSAPRYSVGILVEALYRGILSRGPDEKGFLSNVRRLMSLGGSPKDLGTFIGGFLSSQEYWNKATRQFAQKLIAAPGSVDSESIDVVSLGSHCLVSYALKEMGLKRYSCPFDWIFSRPAMVEHCIKDSFVTLADRSQYQSVIDESGSEVSGRCHHAFYRDTFGVERVFNHRDMRVRTNYEYLLRSIDRFMKLLVSPNLKIFVLLSPEAIVNEEQFVSLHDTLTALTTNFCLLTVKIKKSQNSAHDFGIDHIKSIGPSCLVAMRPVSKAGPLAFEDPFDDFIFRRSIVTFGLHANAAPTIERNRPQLS